MTLSSIPENGRLAAIRFSSLGDVVLVAAALREIRRLRPDIEIALLTKNAFADLFARQEWLTIWGLDPSTGRAGLFEMARRLRAWQPDLVGDMHATLRAFVLRALLPTQRWHRIDKRSLSRYLEVHFKRRPNDPRHVVQRFGDVFGVSPRKLPWLDTPKIDHPHSHLSLVPGAAWATKRWPETHWQQLARGWRDQGGSVGWVGGPDEAQALNRLADSSGGEVQCGLPLADVADYLAGSCAVVSNDTGPGHIASAVGAPVVTLLGPTVQSFGYTPWGRHVVVEADLACRPCSLHGSNVCPQQHHQCMLEVQPDQVMRAIEHQLDMTPSC